MLTIKVMQCFCCQILFLFLSFLSTAKGNLDNDYVCNNAFGLENRQVKDGQLSASCYVPNLHVFDKTYSAKPKYGRLNGKLAWCGKNPTLRSRDISPFFQVDFGETVKVSGLCTQGLPSSYFSYYVKSYVVRFSLDGHRWFNYSSPNKVWSANNDSRTIQRVFFQKPVLTKFLRVYPLTYNNRMCLRVEVYGCDVNGTVNNTQPTSMSQPSSLQPRTSHVTRTAQPTVLPNTATQNQPTKDSTTPLPTGFPVSQNTTTQTQPTEDSTIVHPTESSQNQPTKDFTTLGFKSSHRPNVFNSTLTNTLPKPGIVPSYETATLTSSNMVVPLLDSGNAKAGGVSIIAKNKIIIVVFICIGFVVLLVLSFIVCLVLKMKKRKEASYNELQVLSNVDGDIKDEGCFKALESKSSEWV